MLSLRCPAQNYAWGRPADQSEVAKIAGLNGTTIDESKPYAELWMGTHPSGPAVIDGGDAATATTTLKAWLEQHPEALGDRVRARFGGDAASAAAPDLPYLFKVLSVQTALSIQSHPDKALAEKLHAQNPKDYKDDNHKPEMALALDGFEALCGFVTPDELARELQAQPELKLCVGDDAAAAFAKAVADAGSNGNSTANGSSSGSSAVKAALKAAFTALMTCDAGKVAGAVDAIAARLTQQRDQEGRALSTKEALVLRLNQQYPQDVGVLSAFFLNHITLEPGQAIYLAANEPHAYVSGELVECMAASDNVIRAGLTPKFRDTEVLCSSLTYATGLPQVLEGERVHDHVRAYRPPFDEFEMLRIDVPAGERVAVPTNPGPLLLLVHEGAGSAAASNGPVRAGENLKPQLELRRGSIVFVPAGTDLAFEASATAGLALWAAAVNASVFAPAAPAAAEPAAVPEPALVAA